MKKSDGGLPAAARERRRRRRLFSHPKLAFSLRCCPCASACSPISIGSAPSCRERGHQSSRGSLGTHLSFNLRALFFSLRAAVDRLFSLSLIVPFFSPSSETKRRSSPTTSTSSTRRRPSRPASTSSRGSSSRPTATSWMSSARAASRSPSCSATRRRSSSARRARRCCARPRAGGRGLPRAARSGRREIRERVGVR